MNKTVVAIFKSMNEAGAAADDLFDNGFLKEDIDVSAGEKYEEDAQGESRITRFFKNLFGTNDEKTVSYSHVARKGYVVTVQTHSEDEALEACEILDDNGALDVNDHYNKYLTQPDNEIHEETITTQEEEEEEVAHDNKTSLYDQPDGGRDLGEREETIPVIEEEMQVHKKKVPAGKVKVRSRIVEKPVEENLRLREEHIHIERKKVDRKPTEEELKNFKNDTNEFTEYAEVPEVEKTPGVVEEVRLSKEAEENNETIRDKVKRREVDVAGTGEGNDYPEN